MRHIWSVLCQLTVVDARRNTVSLIETIERLTFSAMEIAPGEDRTLVFPLPIELASLWIRSDLDMPEENIIRVQIAAPSGEILNIEQEFTVDLNEFQRYRALFTFNFLPYVGNGFYHFVVQWLDDDEEWQDAASIPLEVVMETSPDE